MFQRTSTILFLAVPLSAQEPLTLRQAVDLALRSSPVMAAAGADEKATEAGVRQARSRYMPRVQFEENLQRGNNPVFVFSSLLTQRQFRDGNFALRTLNRPEAMNNYQSRATAEEVVFDAQQTRHEVEAARLARRMSTEELHRSRSDLILDVLRAYLGVILAEKTLVVAQQSCASAKADLSRAESILESGRSTQADVLAVRVHLAGMREQEIRATNDLEMARAALNDTLGVGFDRSFRLTTSLEAQPNAEETQYEQHRRVAAENRPELKQVELAVSLARTQRQIAGAAYWPQVMLHGVVEADRQNFSGKGGANWFAGVTLRWTVWNGGETRARVEQARFAETRAQALRSRTDSALELEVRRAYLDLNAAAQRINVASAAAREAEESHRIVQNRHQAGLITVTELLRSETALTSARTRRLAAVYDYRVAAAVLEHATGTLSADSTVVN